MITAFRGSRAGLGTAQISPHYLEKLYESMTRKMAAVFEANGGHTVFDSNQVIMNSYIYTICDNLVHESTYLLFEFHPYGAGFG